MTTPRSQQLANIAGAMPRQNKEMANRATAASDIALKQFVQQSQGGGPGVAQQAAGQAVTAEAAPQLQQQERTMQQQGQLAKMQLAEKQQENKSAELKRRIGGMRKKQEFESMLAKIDNKAKNQLVDRQMDFQQDDFGRMQLTQEQAMDLARLKAKDARELRSYQDSARRAVKNEQRLLSHIYKLLEQDLVAQQKLEHTQRDHAREKRTQQKIASIKNAMEKSRQNSNRIVSEINTFWQVAELIQMGVG